MSKQAVNYLAHHQEVSAKLAEDDVSAIDISVYNALFLIWNACTWAHTLSINRNDVMKMAKVGNKNTYTASLKTLHDKGYIVYEPSHNPLIGSLVTLTIFGKSGFTKSGKTTGKSSGPSTGNSSGNSTGTLYKPTNLETEKQIETLNSSLASANAEVQKLLLDLKERDSEIEVLKAKLEKEKKKVARKKKNETTPHWTDMKELWIEFFKSKNGGQEPTFEGAEGAALASILKRLQKHSAIKPNTRDKAWTVEYAGYVFSHFLQRAYADQFRADNLRLPLLSSHYDSIITGNDTADSKNGKPATGSNVDTGSAFAAIDRHFGKT